jgi:hypothetical protein
MSWRGAWPNIRPGRGLGGGRKRAYFGPPSRDRDVVSLGALTAAGKSSMRWERDRKSSRRRVRRHAKTWDRVTAARRDVGRGDSGEIFGRFGGASGALSVGFSEAGFAQAPAGPGVGEKGVRRHFFSGEPARPRAGRCATGPGTRRLSFAKSERNKPNQTHRRAGKNPRRERPMRIWALQQRSPATEQTQRRAARRVMRGTIRNLQVPTWTN